MKGHDKYFMASIHREKLHSNFAVDIAFALINYTILPHLASFRISEIFDSLYIVFNG